MGERSLGLTAGDVAIHGIDHDRSSQRLCRGGAVRDRLVGRLLGFLGGVGRGSPRSLVFSEVLLQPFGWETHGGYRISVRGEERGGERERVEDGYFLSILPWIYIKGRSEGVQERRRNPIAHECDWSVARGSRSKTGKSSQVCKQTHTRTGQPTSGWLVDVSDLRKIPHRWLQGNDFHTVIEGVSPI